MSTNWLALLELYLAEAVLLMVATYAVSFRLNYYSIVDIAWAYGFTFLAFLSSLLGYKNTSVFTLVGMITIWSLRLGTHLLRRITEHYPTEDGRYAALLASWGRSARLKFLAFFIIQGLSIVFLSIPLLLVASDPNSFFTPLRCLALALWLVALTGETIADRQLSHFKKTKQNAAEVCDVGLWRYSRHPNYFFEWLIWCSYAVFALDAPYGALALLAPASIFYLLFKVTGIPLNEAQSLRSKKEAYTRYQQTTSMFVPWFKRKAGPDAGRKTA